MTNNMASTSADGAAGIDKPQKPQLDEETDPLSTLSFSLSLILQIASTSLHRLSSSTHIPLHPEIPAHIHTGPGVSAPEGLVPPAQMKEDIQELVDDLMERVSWMKDEIGRLEVERKEEEQESRLRALDEEMRQANEEYADALQEAKELRTKVEELLLRSCV
ncbi:hypothetical protein BDZ90DRAFT_260959 [Jaminaea rosea]|uniref:Mediator of RNA polymerase II transcription subunit 21 n=1 Tax=Jaminaea rosea TaxID=1569628 RepID=A0A316UN54_9BASI|nr:hypothetical protein BDZ90DRAFT_260959 [Jaminaea rosea]PWN26696.1 hypothetical protein BDZ90DRAFT_260959 [Jaminaea rosea]